jgi:hypothetical protein
MYVHVLLLVAVVDTKKNCSVEWVGLESVWRVGYYLILLHYLKSTVSWSSLLKILLTHYISSLSCNTSSCQLVADSHFLCFCS